MAKDAEISIDLGFKVGMYIEAHYENPTGSGRILFNLMQDSNNIALHFNPRFDTNVLVLNSMKDGNWQTEERPPGYNLDHGAKMTVKIQGDDHCFTIYINGKTFYQFKYREGLSCTTVKKVQFKFDGNEAVASKLQSMQIGFV